MENEKYGPPESVHTCTPRYSTVEIYSYCPSTDRFTITTRESTVHSRKIAGSTLHCRGEFHLVLDSCLYAAVCQVGKEYRISALGGWHYWYEVKRYELRWVGYRTSLPLNYLDSSTRWSIEVHNHLLMTVKCTGGAEGVDPLSKLGWIKRGWALPSTSRQRE